MIKLLLIGLSILIDFSSYSQPLCKIKEIESLVSDIKTSTGWNSKVSKSKSYFVEKIQTFICLNTKKTPATIIRQSSTEHLNDSVVYYAIEKKLLKVEWFTKAGEPLTKTRLDFYYCNDKYLYTKDLDKDTYEGTYKAFQNNFKEYIKNL